MNGDDILTEISSKLDRVLGLMVIHGLEDEGLKVRRLADLGLDNGTIAILTGLTTNAVAIRRSRMRRRAR